MVKLAMRTARHRGRGICARMCGLRLEYRRRCPSRDLLVSVLVVIYLCVNDGQGRRLTPFDCPCACACVYRYVQLVLVKISNRLMCG